VISSDRHTVVVEERYRIEVGLSKGVRIEIQPATLNAPARLSDAPRADQNAIYVESGTEPASVALSASQDAPPRPQVAPRSHETPPAGTNAPGGKRNA
jgi:hypothetical protein